MRSWSPYAITVLIVAAFYALWTWAADSGAINSVVLASPDAAFGQVPDVVSRPGFADNLFVTLKEVVIGVLIGGVLAVAFAGVCVRFERFREVMLPFVVTLQALPKIILIPLIAIWFENGTVTATIVVAMVSFFPVYVNTEAGLLLSDEDGLRLMHSLRATSGQTFRILRVPTALPLIFTGIKTAINYGVLAAITAEFLGAGQGLGFLIINSTTFLRIEQLYAVVIVVAVIAAAIYAVVELLDRKIVFWRDSVHRDEG